MEPPTIRQRMTLSDQLSVLQSSSSLRDLLTTTTTTRRTSQTLAHVLQAEKQASAVTSRTAASGGRTLLDVIREDEDAHGESGNSSRWQNVTDRLRIRPTAGSASNLEATPSRRSDGSNSVRVSLMTLMEIREREEENEERRLVRGIMGKSEVENKEEDDVAGVVEKHVCCVCMVRKKGAAFIPCGHTFCRVCSRELMAGRGNCPLCNAFILEVLDIF